MIVLHATADGQWTEGGEELVERWRRDGGTLWMDLEATDDGERWFREFGADDVIIEQAFAYRYPPTMDALDDRLFVLLRGLDAASNSIQFGTIQIAFFVASNFVVTRHSARSPSIEHTRRLLTAATERWTPIDILMVVADTVVGRYTPIVLNLESRLEAMEEEMFDNPTDDLLNELVGYKRQLKKLRRIASYHVTILARMRREHHPLITASERDAGDVQDQFERVASLTNLYNELANDLMNGYLSLSAHRLNNIMKVLTIITCIFVPLSFIAGVYGMNFEFMPELGSHAAYFIVLGVMASIAATLLFLFRRLRWF